MRVLDIDLDFFLSGVCELADLGERPTGCAPWPLEDVRAFLETRCGLSRENPLPGAVFETHDGALTFWKARMDAGELTAPFHVTHVDAHSDLGIGRPGPTFVLESVITRPPARRAEIDGYYRARKLDEANYLLFALAFRWISSLDNVRNPASRPDMPGRFCFDGRIRLSSSAGTLIPALDFHEPEVPFWVFDDWREFRAKAPYDFATLAVSPRYSPKEADALIDVFREHVTIDGIKGPF